MDYDDEWLHGDLWPNGSYSNGSSRDVFESPVTPLLDKILNISVSVTMFCTMVSLGCTMEWSKIKVMLMIFLFLGDSYTRHTLHDMNHSVSVNLHRDHSHSVGCHCRKPVFIPPLPGAYQETQGDDHSSMRSVRYHASHGVCPSQGWLWLITTKT